LVLGYAGLFLVTALLAGFYPALVLSGFNPAQTLYNRFALRRKNYLQKGLVVLQFALASFLIIGTIVIFSQFKFLTTEKLGYDDNNLVLVNKENLTRDEAKILRQELVRDPDIIGVAPKDEGYSFNGGKINGDSSIGFANVTIDENYLPLLKIPIVEGRNFSKDYPSDSSHSVIVNETFVKQAGWNKPLGRQVSFNDEKYTVIGVVKDYHFQSLSQKIVAELFSMKADNPYGVAYIKIKPKTETASLNFIEKTFRSLFPLNPYSYIFKNEENLKKYNAEAKWKQIMLYSAILTIFISCIGLFGLSVLSSEKRTKEVGVRKVLGASVANIITILSGDFLKLVLIALLVSIPIAWICTDKWLQNYSYRIKVSWIMIAATALLVILIALITVSFQAIKAAVANPVKSLRTE
jgi:putative ABC transport system permease protein